MIFKTIKDDLGDTKLSVNNGTKSLFDGDFFKKQSVLSDNDIKALQAYNAELERVIGYEVTNGQILPVTTSAQTAFYRTMQDASVEAQNMAASAKGLAVNLEKIPKTSKASQVALSALKTACNMIVFTLIAEGIQLAIEWLSSFNNTTEKLKEKIGELSNKYQEYESELETINQKLEDNKQRIQDILALDTPTYTDEEELKNLEREVELLERRKEVLGHSQDDVAKQNVEAIYKDFIRGYATNDEKFDEAGLKKDTILYTILTGGAYNIYKTAQAETSKTDREKVEELIESYEELASIRENLLNSGEDAIHTTNAGELAGLGDVWDADTNEYLDNLGLDVGYSIDDIDNRLQSYSSSLEKYYGDFSRAIFEISEFDPNLESDEAKKLIGMQDRIYRYINPDEWTKYTVENIVKIDKFSALTKRLQEQITSGLTDKKILEQSETDESLQNLIKAIARNLYGKADEESKKKATSYLVDYLKEGIISEDGTVYNHTSFKQAFNAKEFASAKAKLLDLATSGELSADTISSTEEYKKLMDQTGLSAEQLVEKIKESNIQDNSDNIQYLEGILSDIQSGKTLNLSQASELISENESLAGSVKKVGNSYFV